MNFLIAEAYAADGGVPGAGEAFMLNMLLILILVMMFYVLLILPQQKRFKKHQQMLNNLEKGDRVVTAGGLVGKVDKLVPDKNEVIIDLGNGVKVTALKSTIQNLFTEEEKPVLKETSKKDAPKEAKEEKK